MVSAPAFARTFAAAFAHTAAPAACAALLAVTLLATALLFHQVTPLGLMTAASSALAAQPAVRLARSRVLGRRSAPATSRRSGRAPPAA
ncbi:MAG TPA: hypothetical protein VFX49_05410 [Chloroflexota bacterium]|nr:hypothetical protein [Chloroflexota bacterium]